MTKILPRATPLQRYQAAKIMKQLRDQYPRWVVADMLKMNPAYVSAIEHNMKKVSSYNRELDYYAPSWAVRAVINYDAGKK